MILAVHRTNISVFGRTLKSIKSRRGDDQRRFRIWGTPLAPVVFCLILFGCVQDAPVPPEANLAEAQELTLWRAGAPLYLPEPFEIYRETLATAKNHLLTESSRFRWFRDYRPVQAEFAQLLEQGDELLKRLETEKQNRSSRVRERMDDLRERLRHVDRCTLMINEARGARASLAKAEVNLNEVRTLYDAGQYVAAEEKLDVSEGHLTHAENVITPVLGRYRDTYQLARWKKWASETIEASRAEGHHALLIIKAERKLLLYRDGLLLQTYPIGLGQSGLLDKRRAKDNATPEGKYRITGRNPSSRYHKALLINYPNEEDRREFLRAKKNGLLHETARIGGSIEIHGGGSEGITYGCISLDNKQMEDLYRRVDVGTPVTIVGALDDRNPLSSALTVIQNGRSEKKAP